jgi:hypothetical protein
VTSQARTVLLAWLDSQQTDHETTLRQLSDGTAVTEIGHALLKRSPQLDHEACAAGCAFCCIQPGTYGAAITRAEARTLHAALDPVQDETPWHAQACPALDPSTRTCRAYTARPMICRSYVSRDVAACETIAEGGTAEGAGTLPPQLIYITAHALARAALGTGALTFGLKAIARAATQGLPLDEALRTARLPPGNLDTVRRKMAKGVAR